MAKQLAAWYSDIWKKQLLSQLETDKVNTKPDITSGGDVIIPTQLLFLGTKPQEQQVRWRCWVREWLTWEIGS